jgi:hypothetical protein
MKRNNRREVVNKILEWLKVEGVAYRPKENDSDRFRATINLRQNVNLDIQLSSHRPDCPYYQLMHIWHLMIKELIFG